MEPPATSTGHDELVRVEELRRLKAEVDRIEAEKRKFDAETRGLEREFNRRWFFQKPFIQGLTLGLVTLFPLIWFYVTEVALPVQAIENIRLARDNEAVRDSLTFVARTLDAQIQMLQFDKQNLLVQYAKVDSLNEALTAEYRRLGQELSLSEAGRADFARRAEQLETDLQRARQSRANHPIQLHKGWNLVGFTGVRQMSTEKAFAPIRHILIQAKDDESKIYYPDLSINQIGYLEPGKGYLVFVSRDTTFRFPE